ncbi:Dihydrofolate reductase-like protein [Drosera capensis]
MASEGTKEDVNEKMKMKILCLHGFRTSGGFLQKQISKWDPAIFEHFDLDFPDGLFPAGGKSEIEGIFPPPYFEWFQFNPDFTEYTNLEECLAYICEYITKNGPFDGYLGFSQGAALSGLLLGYQAQGKVLQDHPPIKLLISIAGSKFRKPSIADVAYRETIKVKSVHFVGAKDWLRLPSEDFATAFEDPVIIRHPQGHTVPRLDEAAVEQLKDVVKALVEPSKTFVEDEDAKESDEAQLGEEDKPQDVLGNGKQEEAALDIKIENREVEAVQG